MDCNLKMKVSSDKCVPISLLLYNITALNMIEFFRGTDDKKEIFDQLGG